MTPWPRRETPHPLAASCQVRAVLDDAYNRLIRAMIGTIERLAASDTKYGNKLRLENYSGLLDAIHHHANSVTTLANFRDGLEKSKEAAVQVRLRASLCLLPFPPSWLLLSLPPRTSPQPSPSSVLCFLHLQCYPAPFPFHVSISTSSSCLPCLSLATVCSPSLVPSPF